MQRVSRKAKRLFVLLPLATALLFSACVDFKEPVGFIWPTTLTVPLVNRSYDIKYFVEKSSEIKIDTVTQKVYYSDTQRVEPYLVGDNVTLDAIVSQVEETIGAITITDPGTVSGSVAISDWTPFTGNQTVIVPSTQNNPVSVNSNPNPISAFENATFDSGLLKMIIVNQNGIPLNIHRMVVKNSNGTTVFDTTFSPLKTITSGSQSNEIALNLAGKTVTNTLQTSFSFSTPGTGGNAVTIPAGARTDYSISFSNLVVGSATAKIPAQDPITKEGTVTVDDSTFYREVTFGGGNLQITLTNGLPVPINADLTLYQIQEPNGSVFRRQVTIPAKGNESISIPNLLGYKVIANNVGFLSNEVSYKVISSTVNVNNAVTINKTDKVSASVRFTNLKATSFEGIVKPTPITVEKTSIDLNLEDLKDQFKYDSFKLSESNVQIQVATSAKFDIQFSGVLRGNNGTVTRTLTVNPTVIKPGVLTTLIPPKDLENFLNSFPTALPEKLEIDGAGVANPLASYNAMRSSGSVGKISEKDSIYGDVGIEIPFNVGIVNGVFSDTIDLDIEQDIRDRIKNGQEATVFLEIENGIGAKVQYGGYITDANYKYLIALPNAASNGGDSLVTINGGTVNATTGRVSTPSKDSLTITLKGTDFVNLSEARYIIMKIRLDTSLPAGSPVKFYADDKIKIRAYARLSAKVDF